jgi:hypothetical protein
MKTNSVIISAVVSLLIAIAVYNEGFSQQVQICATCPGNTVTGTKASAFGDNNTASGNYSFVAGRNSFAIKPYAGVIGSWSTASGGHSFVVGSQSQASGDFSYVFGNNSTSEFDFSMALGHNILSRNGGIVLGIGRVDAKLTNNHQESLMIGFNSAYPTIFVSRTPVGSQSGKVSIGNVTSPEAKLHIRADESEDANLLLQATSKNRKTMLLFDGGAAHVVNMHREAPMQFYTGGGKHLSLHLDGESGLVGIGTDRPTALLDINGQLRIRGGNPGTGKVLTSDGEGVVSWETPSGGSNWTVNGSHIYRLNGYVGIGTSSPTTPLHVHKAVTGSYGYVHRIEVTGTATFVNNTKALEIKANTTNDAFLVYGDGRIETKGGHLLFNRTGNSSIRANDDLSFRTNSVERIRITKDGNVGIGTTNPRERLSIDGNTGRPINFHIGGSQNIYSNAYYDVSDKRAKTGPAYAINFSSSRMAFRVAGSGAANSQISWNEVISINTDGNVGIGTTNPQGYKLAVKGKMITEEVVVKLHGSWPDYVFEEGYALKPLAEVGSFIDVNGHLPEVPTAQQVAEDGVSLGEMNALLLKKIEELMLYTLQQQKEIDALKQQMAK